MKTPLVRCAVTADREGEKSYGLREPCSARQSPCESTAAGFGRAAVRLVSAGLYR